MPETNPTKDAPNYDITAMVKGLKRPQRTAVFAADQVEAIRLGELSLAKRLRIAPESVRVTLCQYRAPVEA